MNYRGHITTGILFGAATATGLAFTPLARGLTTGQKVADAASVVCLAALFSLFPDIDIKSKGQMLFYRLFLLFDGYLLVREMYKEAAVLGFLTLLPIISRHRGWTHTIFSAILIPSPLLLAPMYLAKSWGALDGLPYYLGAVAGYVSHLIADGMLLPKKG